MNLIQEHCNVLLKKTACLNQLIWQSGITNNTGIHIEHVNFYVFLWVTFRKKGLTVKHFIFRQGCGIEEQLIFCQNRLEINGNGTLVMLIITRWKILLIMISLGTRWIIDITEVLSRHTIPARILTEGNQLKKAWIERKLQKVTKHHSVLKIMIVKGMLIVNMIVIVPEEVNKESQWDVPIHICIHLVSYNRNYHRNEIAL